MTTTPIRVVAAVVSRGETDAEYLICQRPPHKQHGGLWEFPGGKCEPDESDLAATRRELHEELGVTVTGVGAPLMTAREPGSSYEIVFIPATIEGEPVCHEHDALQWCTAHALLALPLAPSDRACAEWLIAQPSRAR